MAAMEQTFARLPTPQAAWVHQIHAAGGASSSITMVMVFVRSLCFLCGFWLGTHHLDLFYLLTIRFKGVTKCPTQACTIPRAILMAKRTHWSNTERISWFSMTRASLEATGRHHQATTCSVSPWWPPGRQSTKQQCKMYPLCWPFFWPLRRYDTVCITQWRRFMAFIKATKHHHQVSTHSDITNQTHQHLSLFLLFHHENGIELTCWPLITIGVWHIKLTRST